MGSTSESSLVSDSDDEDDASLGFGCGFFVAFTGTRMTAWVGASEPEEESSEEDDSEDDTARRFLFLVRFLTAGGLAGGGAMSQVRKATRGRRCRRRRSGYIVRRSGEV